MDTQMIEEFLEKRLKRLLGKHIRVLKGPAIITKYSGIRTEVFVHISRIEDFDGLMPDGAHTARRAATGKSTYKGFEEERPSRIYLTITCLTGNYKLLHSVCNQLTPEVLLSLELLPRIPLGSLTDESVQLHFEDFNANLHTAEHTRIIDEDTSIFKSELVFYLNGFIHVWLTKKGGFSSKSTTSTRLTKVRPVRRKSSTKPTKRKKSG